jgi:hypothetical protein
LWPVQLKTNNQPTLCKRRSLVWRDKPVCFNQRGRYRPAIHRGELFRNGRSNAAADKRLLQRVVSKWFEINLK